MICNTCGRNILNEEANFCEYCGGSFREPIIAIESIAPQQNKAIIIEPENPISLFNWLGSMFILVLPLLLIPIVGILIFLTILFVWAFMNKIPKTKKNWARATLIFLGIMFVVFAIMISSMMNDPGFQNYMNEIQNLLYNSAEIG